MKRVPSSRPPSLAASALLGLVGLVVVGCAKEPEPYVPPPGGPIVESVPVGEPADVETLNLMVDDAAQYVTAELPRSRVVMQSTYRQVLGIGHIRVAGFPSPVRFEAALDALHGKLMENESLQECFRMVTMDGDDAAEIVRRVGGNQAEFADPRGRDAAGARPRQYKAEDVLVLGGRFFQALTPDRFNKSYRLLVRVEHPHERQTVLSREFRADFEWDPRAGRWVALPR